MDPFHPYTPPLIDPVHLTHIQANQVRNFYSQYLSVQQLFIPLTVLFNSNTVH